MSHNLIADVPATYTVQLYSKYPKGLTKVVRVIDDEAHNALIKYIDLRKGEKERDWYRYYEDKDLLDVVDKAFELDRKAEVFDVEIGNADVAQTFTVLFYVSTKVHKLTVVKNSDEKEELGFYITQPDINGIKEVDWYRVQDNVAIEDITTFANSSKVNGVTYNLVRA